MEVRSIRDSGQWPDGYGPLGKDRGRGLKPGLCHVTLRAALMDVQLWDKGRTE